MELATHDFSAVFEASVSARSDARNEDLVAIGEGHHLRRPQETGIPGTVQPGSPRGKDTSSSQGQALHPSGPVPRGRLPLENGVLLSCT